MHIAILTGGGVPNPHAGGGALTAYTVLQQALESGHRVTAVTLQAPDYFDPAGTDATARIGRLRDRGAEVVVVESQAHRAHEARPGPASRVRRAFAPAFSELYPHVVDGPAMADAVAATGADVAFVYHWEPLAASRRVSIPRVAGVGDPSHLPQLYRWRDSLPSRAALRSSLQVQAAVRAYPGAMTMLLEECRAYGAFAAHHAEWLRRRGAPRCRYLRTPVPDEAGAGWEAARRRRVAGEPLRLLLLGHLKGIATTDGLRVFGRMLPHLDRELGHDGYVVDVVGGWDPPDDLRQTLAHPAVRRHGHSDDPGPWLQQADALLVPTSIPLGIRVRIVTGLSYGTPVVSHRANALGIPELESERNCLLADTPEGLVAECLRIGRDEELRARLSRGARTTYERWFTPTVAARDILALLEGAGA